MSRILKFRAWNKKYKHMNKPIDFNELLQNSYVIGDTIWLQFTGLLDKNGKEIYEGDIIDAPFSQWNAPVVYRNARFELDGNPYVNQSNFQEHSEVYVVIGNIYENPELLK